MPVDALTKDDITKGNAALASLLTHGKLVLVDEAEELDRRKKDPGNKDRSQAASRRTLAKDSWLVSWSSFRGVVPGPGTGNSPPSPLSFARPVYQDKD
eukprot:9230197-Pyramimonas_sp.AAC.1